MKILVIQNENDKFMRSPYLLKKICQHWVSQGHELQVTKGFPEELIDDLPQVDIVILHVDLTRIPEEFLKLCQKYPRVINGDVKDISKKLFSELLVSESDDYDGPVIVKTDANYGGKPENKLLEGEDKSKLNDIFWQDKVRLEEYPIYSSKQEVPYGVWVNNKLIVEKHLPEINEEGSYSIRVWVFLGSSEVHFRNFSHEVIIKGENSYKKELLDSSEVPEELRRIREEFNMDYGKFDYAICDGKVVLYDINKTMGGAFFVADNVIEHLAEGLKDFS